MTASIAPLFRDQALVFISQASTRRNPLSPATIRTYNERIENDILPLIGDFRLDVIDNVRVKALVDEWVEEEVSPSTMRLNFTIIKQILASAVDSKGQPLYPMVWNPKFIQFPKTHPKKALVNAQMLQDAISSLLSPDCRECPALVAVLSGSGLRIGEALAIRTQVGAIPDDSVWIPEEAKIIVRQQKDKFGAFRAPKTEAAKREIDLAPELNRFMIQSFKYELGKPASIVLFRQSRSFYEQRIRKFLKGGFHTCRRFRTTHLDAMSCPKGLSRYWSGHAFGDVHEGYEKYGQEIERRKTEVARIGLGFVLPEVS